MTNKQILMELHDIQIRISRLRLKNRNAKWFGNLLLAIKGLITPVRVEDEWCTVKADAEKALHVYELAIQGKACNERDSIKSQVERLREALFTLRPSYVGLGGELMLAMIDQALNSTQGDSSWQPIETAPKDGTEILAWRKDCGTLLAKWGSAAEFMNDREQEKSGMSEDDLHEPDWFYADFIQGGRLDGDLAPTLWMPLPEPTSTQGDK